MNFTPEDLKLIENELLMSREELLAVILEYRRGAVNGVNYRIENERVLEFMSKDYKALEAKLAERMPKTQGFGLFLPILPMSPPYEQMNCSDVGRRNSPTCSAGTRHRRRLTRRKKNNLWKNPWMFPRPGAGAKGKAPGKRP